MLSCFGRSSYWDLSSHAPGLKPGQEHRKMTLWKDLRSGSSSRPAKPKWFQSWPSRIFKFVWLRKLSVLFVSTVLWKPLVQKKTSLPQQPVLSYVLTGWWWFVANSGRCCSWTTHVIWFPVKRRSTYLQGTKISFSNCVRCSLAYTPP